MVPGWELALPLMRVGESAELVCEPRYAFGDAGAPPRIPPNATVRFELELLATRDLLSSNNTEEVELADRYASLMLEKEKEMKAKAAAVPMKRAEDDEDDEDDEDEVEPLPIRPLPQDAAPELSSTSSAPSLSEALRSAGQSRPEFTSSAAAEGAGRAASDAAGGERAGITPSATEDANNVLPVNPPNPAGARQWIPSATRVEVEHPDGYSWRETDDEIEMKIPLPPGTPKAGLEIEIEARSIRVAVGGAAPILEGPLNGKLIKEDSSWSLSTDGDAPLLQLDLMKRPSADGALWGYVLKREREAAEGFSPEMDIEGF